MLKNYEGDFHTHSFHSDGIDSPAAIVRSAYNKGLSIVALTDHNEISGWNQLFYTAKQVQIPRLDRKGNQIGTVNPLLVIPGLEVSTQQGHVVVLIPERESADTFATNFRPAKGEDHTVDVIQKAVSDYNAICILVHPGFGLIHSLSFAAIEHIRKNLDDKTLLNVGIEAYNWMSQVFFWEYLKNANELRTRNTDWGFATFAGTDAHIASQVGNSSTRLQMTELTPQAFITAVQERRTQPLAISGDSSSEYASSFITSAMIHGFNQVKKLQRR